MGKGVRKPVPEAARGEPWAALGDSARYCLRAPCAEWAFSKCWCIDLGQGYGSASSLSLSRTEASPLPSPVLPPSAFLVPFSPFPCEVFSCWLCSSLAHSEPYPPLWTSSVHFQGHGGRSGHDPRQLRHLLQRCQPSLREPPASVPVSKRPGVWIMDQGGQKLRLACLLAHRGSWGLESK